MNFEGLCFDSEIIFLNFIIVKAGGPVYNNEHSNNEVEDSDSDSGL